MYSLVQMILIALEAMVGQLGANVLTLHIVLEATLILGVVSIQMFA